MDNLIKIVIDTIGGDNGPAFCVKGAVKGLENNKDIKIFLAGHKDEILDCLSEYEYDNWTMLSPSLNVNDIEFDRGL